MKARTARIELKLSLEGMERINKKLDRISAFITTNKNDLTPKILVLILQFR